MGKFNKTGKRAPPEGNAYFAAGHMGPALLIVPACLTGGISA